MNQPTGKQWLTQGTRSGPAERAAKEHQEARSALEAIQKSWHLHEAVVKDRTRRVSQALSDPTTATGYLVALHKEVHRALGGK